MSSNMSDAYGGGNLLSQLGIIVAITVAAAGGFLAVTSMTDLSAPSGESLSSLWSWLVDGTLTTLPYLGTITVGLGLLILTAALALAVVASTVAEENTSEDSDGPRFPALLRFATGIRAFGAGLGLIALWFGRHWILENRWTVLVVGAVLFVSWVVYVYLRNRQRTARRSTAIDRTQRNVGDSVENWTQFLTGAAIVVASIALSIVSGVFSSVGQLDQFLTPILNELSFVGLTLLGYVQLGGEFWGSAWVPELNALQWLGVALLIGAFAVVFRED